MSTLDLTGLVPTTELEAVNFMLTACGDAAIESLNTPLRADAEIAYNVLKAASRTIQSKGWHCNTARAVTLTAFNHAIPVIGDKIQVPTGSLKIRKTVIDSQRNYDIGHREGFLWNNATNTSLFPAASFPNGIKVDIVYALDYIAMPEALRAFIFVTAARAYAERTVGNPDLSTFLRADEAQALANLVDAEGLAESTSILESHKDQRTVNAAFDKVSREVQSIGWHFNTRKNVGIPPLTSGGNILLPTGTLQAVKTDRADQANLNVAHRGYRMYDVTNDTYTFSSSDLVDGMLYLDLTMYLSDPLDLPECARRYIEIKTARQLQPQKQTGPNAQGGYTERDEFKAFLELQDAQGLIEDCNLAVNMDVYRTMYGRYSVYGSGNLR